MEGWVMLKILMVGAVVAAVLGASLLTGGHSGARAAGSGERFTSYQAPTGEEMSPAQAQTGALHVARMAHQEGALELATVHATFAQAHAVLMGEQPSEAEESGPAERLEEMRSSVWVTMMTASAGGVFTPIGPVPRKHSGPAGTVMVVVADAHTGFVKEEYVGPAGPDIGLLGPALTTEVMDQPMGQSLGNATASERLNPNLGEVSGRLSPPRVSWPVTIANVKGRRLAMQRTSAAGTETKAGSFFFRELAGTYVLSAPHCGKRTVRVHRHHGIATVTLHCSIK
jgi:hypothetical protein